MTINLFLQFISATAKIGFLNIIGKIHTPECKNNRIEILTRKLPLLFKDHIYAEVDIYLTEQYSLQKYKSLESFALDQTEQFFKPRTFLDLVFLLLLIFWWISAFFFSQTGVFRATIFTGLIVLFVFTPLYIYLKGDDKSAASPMNRAGKILIFYIIILISTPSSTISNIWGSTIPISYGELERALVCILIPFTILLNNFSLKMLKMGYLFYIQRILQGFWLASLIFYIFKGIQLYHPIDIFPIDFDFLLFITFFMFLGGSLFPVAPKQLSLSTTDLFNQYQALKSPTERIRDALLAGAFCLLIVLLLKWVDSAYIELFQYTAFLSLLIGFILIFTPKKQDSRFGSLMSAISSQGQVIDPSSSLGNRVQNFAKTIQETEFRKSERVYTIPTDQMKLVSKGKTSVRASKGAIAVPTVTEKGTALVLMGKSEMETQTEDQEASSKKEIKGTTTIWLKPEEWNKIKLQLNPKEMSELTEFDLKTAGINTTTEIFEKTRKALNDLKSWRGPQGIFSSVLDSTPSKYSITETEDYSLVRLPGVYVFESNMLELVNVLGGLVKVIEVKGVGQYVQVLGGFVTVLETTDYSFVQTPFVSVIETPVGEKVRVFGIDIQEGDPIDLEEMRTKIIQDKQNFDQLFTKRVESLFKEDPQLLLTDSKGEKTGFIVGEDELLSDVPTRGKGLKAMKGLKGLKSLKGIEGYDSKHRHRHKHSPRAPSPPLPPPPPRKRKKITVRFPSDLNSEEIPVDHPQLQEIEEALTRIEESINATDEKFLNNEISEKKHTEIINRLNVRKEKLQRKKEELNDNLKPKLV
ncbi:MAG: hypothetical protein ACFFB5_02410 [Promethearchaeota archaeon]